MIHNGHVHGIFKQIEMHLSCSYAVELTMRLTWTSLLWLRTFVMPSYTSPIPSRPFPFYSVSWHSRVKVRFHVVALNGTYCNLDSHPVVSLPR